MFILILIIITFFTGIFWFLDCFIRLKVRYYCQVSSNYQVQKQYNISDCINNKYHNKLYWIKTFSSMFPVLFSVFIVRSFIFEPFHIPSGSMMPTLLTGDFILVKKFVYGIKNPITQTTLVNIGHPKRGDIVVLKYPLDPSLTYIKRAVGLPGDLIRYDEITKKITIYPNFINNKYNTKSLPIKYSNITPSSFVQFFHNITHSQISSTFLQIPRNIKVHYGIRLDQRKESLGDITYDILTIPIHRNSLKIFYQQTDKFVTQWIVPQGQYFMMGDNRDNSSDSRFWGFVPEKNLVGKATIIWMSLDKNTEKWPIGIRLSRIGKINS